MIASKVTSLVCFSIYFVVHCLLLGIVISMTSCLDVNNLGKEIVKANNRFAFDLYDVVKEEEEKDNIFISPLCISSCMGMLYMMTNGTTAQEISEAMHFPPGHENTAAGFEQCLKGLDKEAFSWANSVFLSKHFNVKSSYSEVVSKYWSAAAERLDFIGEPKKSREHINDWVANNTNQMIKNLMPESFPQANTAMVLVSALHFKRPWLATFQKMDGKGTFRLADGKTVDVDMIYAEDTSFAYKRMRDIQVDVLKIPYKGSKQSLLIFLPFKNVGLPAVERRLKQLNLEDDVLKQLRSGRELFVKMPKFKLEDSYQLRKSFEKLGMKSVFDSTIADFTRGSENENLELSEIYHKTMIIVDEKGTEASAATGDEFSVDMMPMIFEVDRPFVFALIDSETNLIMFLGRFALPTGGN